MNVWTKETGSDWTIKKMHNMKLHIFLSAPTLSSVFKLCWMESEDLVVHLKKYTFIAKLCMKLDTREKIKSGFSRLVVRSSEQLLWTTS